MLNNQQTLLHSIPSGDIGLIRQAIENGADVNHIHDIDGTGMRLSYLHTAAAAGRYDVMDLLVSKGANVNARSRDGETPLQFAAAANNVAGARLLLSSGAHLDAEDKNKVTAIEEAVANNHSEMTQLLSERGAQKSLRVVEMIHQKEDQQPAPLSRDRITARRAQASVTPAVKAKVAL